MKLNSGFAITIVMVNLFNWNCHLILIAANSTEERDKGEEKKLLILRTI